VAPPKTRAERQRIRRGGARADPARPSGLQLAIAGFIAVVGVLAFIALSGGASPSPSSTLVPGGGVRQASHVRGSDTAPITIEEWADFQCPACGMFARTTEPQLVTTYVSRGQVKIIYRHFAFLGQESQWAAEASECADEEGKFWEFHDRLFASQAGENRGTFSKDNLKRIGEALGLSPAFAACVDSGRHAQRVRDETQVGQRKDVRATPTLFVQERKIEGAATFDQLRTIVDALIAPR
jgi:protein-disulfide isomerase